MSSGNNNNNVPKYFAIALAGFIGVLILSIIVSIVVAIFGSFNVINYKSISQEVYLSAKGVSRIEIDNVASDIILTTSESTDGIIVNFKNVPENYSVKVVNGKLIVKGSQINGLIKGSKIVITVPKMEYERLEFDNVLDRTEIVKMSLKELDIKTVVGEVSIINVFASKADIEGGASSFVVKDSEFDIFKYSAGVGRSDINLKVNDLANISCGIGNVNINFANKIEDFANISISSGVGVKYVDGVREQGNYLKRNQNGFAELQMTGGVGNIDIMFGTN